MSLSHFFSITQTWRIAISWLDTPGRILSSTWYHRWLQLVTPMRQNAQKRSRKFYRSKEGKNSETHPIQPEKGETGCVLDAGGDENGWGRVQPDEKPSVRTNVNHRTMQHKKTGENPLFSPVLWQGQPRPVRSRAPPALAHPTTRTARGAAVPRSQILLHTNEKVRYRRSDT